MNEDDKKSAQKALIQKNIEQIEMQVEQFRFTLSVAENTLAFLKSQAEALK